MANQPPDQWRLRNHPEFFLAAERLNTKHLTAWAQKTAEIHNWDLRAVLVPLSACKHHVQRNRCKRIWKQGLTAELANVKGAGRIVVKIKTPKMIDQPELSPTMTAERYNLASWLAQL